MLSSIGDLPKSQCRRRFQHCERIIAQPFLKGIRFFLKCKKTPLQQFRTELFITHSLSKKQFKPANLNQRHFTQTIYLSVVAMPVRMA
jgi:hypothetical protein